MTTITALDARIDVALASIAPAAPARLTVHADRVHCIGLDGDDPVRSLLGWVAPSDAIAVGVDAPAFARSTVIDGPTHSGRVRHVQFRDGTCTTSFVRDGEVLTTTSSVTSGRVPDLCRRALGLATDPPPSSMTTFVTDAWLHILAAHAVTEPVLDWRRAVMLHPGASTCDPLFGDARITPARLAESTSSLGHDLDWERFRVVSAALGSVPMIDLSVDSIEWMDTGMFARWALDHITPRATSLAVLSERVAADTLDRIWATVMLVGDD